MAVRLLVAATLAGQTASLLAQDPVKDALTVDEKGNVTILGDLRARSIILPIYDVDDWETFRKGLGAYLENESRNGQRIVSDQSQCLAYSQEVNKNSNPSPQNVRSWLRMSQEKGFKFDFKYKQIGEKRISFMANDTQSDPKAGSILFPFADLPVPSDARLKSDVVRLSGALDRVRKLHGVTYQWNELGLEHLTRDAAAGVSAGPEATAEQNQTLRNTLRQQLKAELAGTRVGVLAQEVEAVLPEAVTTVDGGFKHVRYQDLIPLLIEAVKQQDELVREQAATLRQRTEVTVRQQRDLAHLQDNQPKLEAELAELRTKLKKLEEFQQKRAASTGAGRDVAEPKP